MARRELKNREFSDRLLELIKERGLSIAKTAELSCMARSTLHNWTAGSRPQDYNALERLSDVLETDFYYLLLGKRFTEKDGGKNE